MIEYQLINPVLYGNLFAIRRKIYPVIARLDAQILPSAEPIPFAELENYRFSAVNGTVRYGRLHTCAWIRLNGRVPEDAVNPVLLLALNGEAQIYSPEGGILGAVTGVWAGGDVRRSAGWRLVDELPGLAAGAEVACLLDCGYNGFDFRDFGYGTFKGAFIAERNEQAYAYYYDYLTLLLYFSSTRDRAKKRALSRALHASFARFAGGEIADAREILRPILQEKGENEFVYSAIGHGHLDLAWMWPMRETMRKAARTMSIALNNIDRYDGFRFGTSQPQQLQWIKDQHPALYERTKQAIANGSIELQGGFWVECDCNISSGESLIRQAIYGKRFVDEEFGKQMRMCWLPDAFGFNGNLPQILRGCGMEYFSTIKLTWNQTYKFPYRTFWWEGIDGTRVLVHMPPEGTYNSTAGPHALLQGVEKYTERALNTALLVFGSGDGGGGPKESHLELLQREHDIAGLPRVRMEHAIDFFDRLAQKDIDNVWSGELYLDVHQGTYTTQSETKRYNRLMERLLHEAEALGALNANKADGMNLEALWKETLLYQFHDILPGSSIGRVYRESHARYAQMVSQLASVIDRYLPRGSEPAAVNLSAFARRGYVNYLGRWYTAQVAPYAAQALKPYAASDALIAEGDILSNGILTLRFDKRGEIVSCKTADGRELAKGPLNRLTLYRDHFPDPYNAWNIDPNYMKKPRRVLAAKQVSVKTDGPLVIRTQTYETGKSKIDMRIILTRDSDVVRVETKIDWHETHRMLRADYYPADFSDTADFGIQFGTMQRSTRETSVYERSQFEVCAHRWASVQKNGRGFALLCDVKYGYRVKNGLMSLDLLRSPVFPDPDADRGTHEITYAFCPIGEDNAHAIEEGYRLGHPLILGEYAPFDSMARVSDPGVILETIKRSEDGRAVVLRLYESLGRENTVSLTTRAVYEHARACDLTEEPIGEIDLNAISFHPYEIKTIRLEGAHFGEQA